MSPYVTDPAFNELYFDFTGHHHGDYPPGRRAIAQDLANAIAGEAGTQEPGTLVVATKVGLFAYDPGPGHRRAGGVLFRAAPNSGFYEVTSISHVGPAIAYLATLKEMGRDDWRDHVEPMIAHLRAVRAVNAAPPQDHWLQQLSAPAWAGREARIQAMIDYACALAGNYLVGIRDDPDALSSSHVVEHFLDCATPQYPIGFNAIMVGTFAVEALKSVFEIYGCLAPLEIEWSTAQVLLHNLAGVNYSAGLTPDSNWLHAALLGIAGPALDPERIIIAPYAPMPESVGGDALPDEVFEELSASVWGALYARPRVVQRAFAFVDDISRPRRPPIPGDYDFTRADQMDHFVRRLKYSTGTLTEMLSNTVGFWIAGEASAKAWVPLAMDIPGLTHGLPNGLDGYPVDAPVIAA